MSAKIPYLFSSTDRHGNVRHYARKRGAKQIRIREPYGSPAFLNALSEAVNCLNEGTALKERIGPAPKTLSWLGQEYEKSYAFKKELGESTQAERRAVLRNCFAVTVKPGSKYVMGQCPLAELVAKHIRIIRDDKVDFPTAANSRVKALRVMLAWAVEADHIKHNFAKEVSLLKVRTDGYHSWTPEEVKQFEVKHPTGTKERLGLALMLYTGGRRSDAVLLGPSHIKDEVITFTPVKTRRTTGKVLQLPLLPQLQTIIAATATGEKTFLTTARGLSFSPSYFGTFFRQACDEAGLPKCTPHGLRKAGAVIAAERGATDEQLKAIFGWSSSAIVAIYTKQARQKKVAGGAMHLIVAG